MGIVYRSEQESPRRPVALKILRSELADPASLQRFQQEVEILGRLSHPGIAQIYEAGTFDTELGRLPYLAMELIEGAPLLEHARELSVPEKLERIVAIAEAVQHAHSKGVVHRDLKPSNLLVEEGGAIKVLDFGAARFAGEGTTLTASGQMLGTVPYMSPEQLAGRSDVDERSDVYSLGVCLYQLLVGRLPIEIGERCLPDAIRLLEEREPTRLGAVDSALAGDIETIVHHALAKDRERRYASAADMAEDLRRFLRREPIQARPTSHLYVLTKLVRRHRIVAVAGVLVIAALSVAWLSTRARHVESERVELLTTVQHLRELREGAIELWPHVPHRRSAWLGWIARSEALAAELPGWERRLSAIRTEAEAHEGNWRFGNEAEQRFHDELSTLVTDLARFADPDPSLGLLADVRARERQVEGLVAPSIGSHRADWERCFAALDANPRYAGVALDIQPGLVPLREDPHSGLWEFWHEASGSAPEIAASSGRWRIQAETGLVLVLIPGGTFRMGAQNRDPEQPNWSWDLRNDEMLVHEVRLEPFFLSKYELTQAQWERLMGERRSSWPPPSAQLAGVHPVEDVSWEECALRLTHGLTLPSEAQWEYAARAGTATTWFGGNDFDSLGRYANIKDQSYRRTVAEDDVFTAWDDGHANHAPVGSFEPNPFGLHDILGNVWEWCRDTYGPYELPTADWNAVRVVLEPVDDHRVFRGGCYDSNITWANSSARNHSPTGYRRASLGLRPVMMMRPL